MDLYLMSPPSRGWSLRGRANFRSREAPAVDPAAARREWLALARAIQARGGTIVALPSPSDELTGMPYAAECGHALAAADGGPPLFLLPRMAAPHRRAETPHWAALARTMGFRVVDAPASAWEAQGDVAEMEGVTLLFHGGRTERAGMEAVRHHFTGEVLPIAIREPAFHGNMAVLPLPEIAKILVCPAVIAPDDLSRLATRFGNDRLIPVTEDEIRRYSTNALPIGRDLLAPTIVPDRVRALLEALGMNVILFPMPELCEKAGGASRCLVSRAAVDPARIQIPDACRLDAIAADIEMGLGAKGALVATRSPDVERGP